MGFLLHTPFLFLSLKNTKKFAEEGSEKGTQLETHLLHLLDLLDKPIGQPC